MYKDKEKQKEANRVRQQRRRDAKKLEGVTIAGRDEGVTSVTVSKCDKPSVTSLPANFGQPDCECKHCQSNRANGNRHIINHGPYKSAKDLAANELNRVSLPGDIDYEGIAVGPEPACAGLETERG